MTRECVAADSTAGDRCSGDWLVLTSPTGETVETCTGHASGSIEGAAEQWGVQSMNVTVTGEPVGE